ncbi:MAG: class II fructose-bisphosphate aldolase, partial [Clostridia bacterium]|nr:class II fructose-bisphosphate aldolase [Clostridia bacterium]
MDTRIIVRKALENGLVIPAFNIPHPPMLKAIAQAIVDENSVAMIQVARLEWEKFESESLENIAEEYAKYAVEGHTLLHLDHVPVIDEDHKEVDYIPIIKRAISAGYGSVMVDASRLDLEGNIAATRAVADIAHAAGIPVEAELGAVMGHETEQTSIPYEEIFAKKMGFTRVDEALKFVKESECDWLSVAVGSVHGAIA